MNKLVIGNGPELDLAKLIDTRLLVQANSGGGKSWLIRRLLEQSHGKVQQIIIDLEGEFSTLREKYDYVLAGKDGDTAADPRSAALLARRLLELNVSAIVDLYELSHQDRKRFVRLFLSAMINAPKSLWHPVMVVIDEAHVFCLDTDTEILTSEGWKRHNSVEIGDKVIAFNLETDTYHEEAIEGKIYKSYSGDMVHLRSDGIDSIVTPEHRVVLRKEQRAVGRYKLYDWSICMADKVPQHVYIPKGGAPSGQGVDISDDILTAMGWIITDGYLRKDGAVSITQAPTTTKKGVNIVGTMDLVLGRLGCRGRYTRTRKPGVMADGRLRPETATVDYYLGTTLSQHILLEMPLGVHRIPRHILEHATTHQLSVIYEALMQGDGTAVKGKWRAFYPGHNEALSDDFQELTTRLGISTVKKKVPQTGQWTVGITNRKHHYIRKTRRVHYDGEVWCITVPSGAFVARRNGKVFVTGNCPQTGSSEAMEAVIDLATRGRKRGFCAVLATQRISKLHKDAVAEMNNKLIGRTGLDIDRKRAAEELGFTTKEDALSLRNLAPGSFYAFGPAISDAVTEVTVGSVNTSHPKAGDRILTNTTPPTEKIKALLSKLADLPVEARQEAETMESLREQVSKLTRDNKRLSREQPAPPPQVKVETKYVVDDYASEVLRKIHEIAGKALFDTPPTQRPSNNLLPQELETTEVKITGGAMRMLEVLATRYPMTFTKSQLALMAKMSPRSGSYGTYLSRLRSSGYLLEADGQIGISDAGLEFVGVTPNEPQSQEEVLAMWSNNLNGGARRMFDYLVQEHPRSVSKQELGEAVEMSSNSGSFGTYLSRLKSNGLIKVNNGSINASPDLFLSAANQEKTE